MNRAEAFVRVEKRMKPLLAHPRVLHRFGWMRRKLEALGIGTFSVRANGLKVSGGIGDRKLLLLLEKGKFEPLSLPTWRSLLEPGMRAIDVGAHIGSFTLPAAQVVGDKGRVWALEPNPVSFRYLQKNVSDNELGQVTVVQAAVSDHTGSEILHVRPGERMQSSLVAVDAGSETDYKVDVLKLDDLVPLDETVDVLKIDAEGSEPAILRGMARLLPGVRAMIVEQNPDALRQGNSSPTELHDMLVEAGFEVQVMREKADAPVPWTVELADRAVNLLATRPGDG